MSATDAGSRIAAGGYDVLVGRGLLARLPALLAEACPAYAYAVIADAHVAERHGPALLGPLEAAGLRARLVPFPAGEWNKSREQWAELTDRMLAAGFGRDAAVIAFGGGVAGDLGGFVAATYLRGIPAVQVPTTLLAMIDASVGGKTALDVPAGKNLVGAFHPPRLVVADVELLATLPRAQLAAGLAEALKHAAIRDAAYLDRLADPRPVFAHDLDALQDIVRRSVEIKAEIVAADPLEAGPRQMLNFGHTIAHAVETVCGFDLLHGECVAIGMLAEAAIGEQLGATEPDVRAQLLRLCDAYALPLALPAELPREQLLEVMRRDKKSRGDRVRLALPQALGVYTQRVDGAWTVEVDEELLLRI